MRNCVDGKQTSSRHRTVVAGHSGWIGLLKSQDYPRLYLAEGFLSTMGLLAAIEDPDHALG